MKEEKKAEEKKAEKEEAEERLEEANEPDPFDEPVEKTVRIEASNINELLEKIKNLDWDAVEAKTSAIGNNIDFTA